MTWIATALWGLFGVLAVEAIDIHAAVRRYGSWPWRVKGARGVGALGYVVAGLIQVTTGVGLATAATLSGQITSPLAAMTVGMVAPLILERVTRAVPIVDYVQEKSLPDATPQNPRSGDVRE